MANFSGLLQLTGTLRGISRSVSKNATLSNIVEYQRFERRVDHAVTPEAIWTNTAGADRGAKEKVGPTYILVTNVGDSALEIFETYESWKEVGGEQDVPLYVTRIFSPGDFMFLPTQRGLVFDAFAKDGTGVNGTNNVSMVTDGNGYNTTSTFWGELDTAGITPGSIGICFYEAAYQELGMTNTTNKKAAQTSTSDTGLTTTTAYDFGINIDAAGAQNITFTTDSTLWGLTDTANTGVLRKINAALEDAHAAGTIASLPTVSIVDGDIKFTSATRFESSTIALSAGSVNSMFGAGNIPAIGDIDSAFASTDTIFTTQDMDDVLIDQGDGTGTRTNGGTFTFYEIDEMDTYKENGLMVLENCPPNASFYVNYDYNAPHSGEADASTDENVLLNIGARSLNARCSGIVEIIVLN